MFASKRSLFGSENGSVKAWLAGVTSVALLIGTVALPAVAEEAATPVEEQITQAAGIPAPDATTEEPAADEPDEAVIDEPIEAVAEEPAAEESVAEAAPAEEAVIGEPIEDEAAPADAPEAPVADDPAASSEEPAPAEAPAASTDSGSASSTDGTTPDNNGPPVEEFVPGISVETTADGATISWPDFGLDENYIVQMEKKDGTWKNLDAEVEPTDSSSTRDYEATVDGLTEGQDYTLRILTAETPELAESATEDAVETSVAGPGLGSIARAVGKGNADVVTSHTFVVTPLAAGDPFIEGEFVNTKLTGCRADTSAYTRVPTVGPFQAYICPDDDYIPANLAKGWNELDLVPHRLWTELGKQSETTTYDMIIAGDNSESSSSTSYEGYDVITVPIINPDLSDSSCMIEVGPQLEKVGATGGAWDSVYRFVRITQEPDTTCVLDFDMRLSNTAANYSGSSLQSYIFGGEDFSTGKKTVSIPVKSALPQELDKTSSALRDESYTWEITKSSDPRTVDWSDTCSVDGQTKDVSVLVTWTKEGPTPSGMIAYEATVTATNPSKRAVRVSVTDAVYGVDDAGMKSLIDTVTLTPVTVPAGQTVTVGSYTMDIDDDDFSAIYDLATGQYYDLDLGLDIEPDKTADHTATIQTGKVTNNSVEVKDVEQITSGFTFSVKSTTDASGFPGGALPTNVTSATWTKQVSADGAVSFVKSVTPTTGYVGGGTLSDVAAVSTLAGAKLDDATASTTLSASKKVDLTVWKTTPMVFEGTNSATFTFELYKGTIEQGDTPIATKSVTIDNGSTVTNDQYKESATFTDLAPGVYTVRELDQFGWAPQSDQEVDLSAEDVVCKADVTFDNTLTELKGAPLEVTKDATPSYVRDYKWTIDKKVKPEGTQNVPEGTKATFDYTVEVKRTTTDSNFDVDGTIKVYNPNKFAVQVTSLVDKIGAQTCTLIAPPSLPYSLAGEATLQVGYDCDEVTGASATAKGVNKATATWPSSVKVGYLTYTFDNTSDTGEAPFDFATAKPTVTGFQTVKVSDPMGGAGWPKTTADTDDLQTFTYSKSFDGTPGECTTYDNTATIVETSQMDSESVEVCVGVNLTIDKTVTAAYGRLYKWNIDKRVDDTKIEIAEGGQAKFTYTVKATPDGYTDSEYSMDGVIRVTNPNKWQDITATITDSYTGGGTCTVVGGASAVIPKNGSKDFAYSCEFSSAPAFAGTNTATATWDKATFHTPKGSATVDKSVTFSLSSTDRTVTVVDDKTSATPKQLGTVTANLDGTAVESQTVTSEAVKTSVSGEFRYSLTKSGVAAKCTDYTNTAWLADITPKVEDSQEVTVCVGVDLTVTKTATGTFDRTYNWLIDKSVDDTRIEIAQGGTATFNYTVKVTPNDVADSGYTLGGTITVANPNEWQDVEVSVADVVDNGGVCTMSGLTDGMVSVPKDGKVTLDYTCTFAEQPSSYEGMNTATATWDEGKYFTPTGTASGTADFKMTEDVSTNKVITVIDDKTDPANPVTLGQVDYYTGILGSEDDEEGPAVFEFTYSLQKQGVGGTCTDYTNIAVIDETDQSDTQVVTVCVGQDLTITKSATGTYNRLYNWTIDKSVDQTSVLVDMGGSATFNYTVKVAEAGFVDSGWALMGSVKVTNPNNWQDIIADVTDEVDNGGICAVTGGVDVVVPAGKSVELPYSCTFASQPAYTGSNTGTVTWDKATAFTLSGTASAKVAFTMGMVGETNKTIEVVDDKTNPAATPLPVLGQATYGVARSPFTYQLVKPAPTSAGTCASYTNTAVIVQTKQSDAQAIQVCTGLLDKTSDPAEGSVVAPDQLITYSVKVTNTSAAPASRPVVDTLPEQIIQVTSISDGGVLSGRTITWQVTLAAGESKTLTYVGLVDPEAATGQLLNTAAFAGLSDQTIHSVEAVVEEIEEEVVAAEEEELADTGADNVGNFVGAALLAMFAGGLMVTFGRRRREQ